MLEKIEESVVGRLQRLLPDPGWSARAQFSAMLPTIAIFSAMISLFLGGGAVLLRIIATGAFYALLNPVVWFIAGPPILWALAYRPLQARRRFGWRLFAVAALLSLTRSVLAGSLFGLLFDLLFTYAAIISYDEYVM